MGAPNLDADHERAQLTLLWRGVVARQGFQRVYGGDAGRLAADGPGFPHLLAWAAAAGVAREHLVADVRALAGPAVPAGDSCIRDNRGCPPPYGGPARLRCG